MRGVLAILIALTVALAPLHAATAALCVEAAPASQQDACCSGGAPADDASPQRQKPADDPCEGCDCSLACCGVLVQTVAPPTHFDSAPRGAPAIALGASLDDAPPPDRRPAGLRRPPRLGLLR